MTKLTQFIKYSLSGSIAVLFRLIILWVGVEYLLLGEILSAFIGAICSVCINYLIQHKFVFRKSGSHLRFFSRFIFVVTLMQSLNLFLFWLLLTYTNIQYILAQTMAIGIIFVINYIINSRFTFKQST